MSRTAIAFATLVAISFAPSNPVFAAGGGDDTATPACSSGQVWDKQAGKCVQQSSALDTDSLYETGRRLAKDGRYGEAIAVLSLAADRGDARVLNYLGYSHRMQGRVVTGLGYYQEALRIDPAHTLVRSYMGEAYLQLDDVASAEGELRTIASLCGTGCAEYAALDEQIRDYRRQHAL